MSARCPAARGFTLLEMTVVLLLIGLMSVIMMHGLRFGTRAYTQVIKVDAANREVFAAQQFLRGVLETVYPFDPERAHNKAFGLEGSATRLSFSAARSRSAGPGALQRYEVFTTADAREPQRLNLLVSWRPDRDGRPNPPGTSDQQEVLVENVSRIEWSYIAVTCNAAAENGKWQSTWQGQRKPPALVRARVVFPKDDPRQWPDLIVAPQVTDDAMAWFDQLNAPDSECEKTQ